MTEKIKNKKNIFIWGFGTSDMYIDWWKIKLDFKKESFFEKTKEINKNWNSFKDKIDFPIIRAIIEDEKFDKSKDIILKWIFTNQNENSEWKKTDTIYLEYIFKKWLNYNKDKYDFLIFANDNFILSNPINIEVIYNEITQAIDKQITNNNYFKKIDIDTIYINTTGGTKQMIIWLVLSVLSKFDIDKLKFIYGEQRDKETIPRYQNIYRDWFYDSKLKKLVERWDFEFIKYFIDENNLKEKYKKIYDLSSYWVYRLLCNWEKVYDLYRQMNISDVFYVSKDVEKNNLLNESINGIIYTFRQNRLAEFMGRVYNFVDGIIWPILLKNVFWKDIQSYVELKQIVRNDNNLKIFLDNYILYGNNLAWDFENDEHKLTKKWLLTSAVKIAMVEYLVWKNKVDKKFEKILNSLKNLNQYRNKTIIWHWTNPISKQIIQGKLQVNDVETFFSDILKSLLWNNILWIDILKNEILKEFEIV